MTRILVTNSLPDYSGKMDQNVAVVTPHRAAASALGVSYYSLPRLAREVLRKNREFTVAPDIFARHTLKSVVARKFPESDPASIATRIREILETVLRVGIDIEELIEHGSSRVQQLAIITKAYRAELQKNNYIDRAELLWSAANCEPEPRPLFIYGHHRARKEEIVFIDAVAGEGSKYFLPCDADGIFTGNREWAEWLEGRGWQIEDGARKVATSLGERLATKFIGFEADILETTATAYPNIEAEVRGVLSQAKTLIVEGTDPYEIAIVCRNQDDYAPIIAAVADEYGLPVRIDHNVRLKNTVFGGFVRLILDAVEQDFSYETAARLVMHPFGPETPEGAWTEARLKHASGIGTWSALGIDLSSMVWSDEQSLQSWMISLRKVFEAFEVRKKAASRAREIIAHESFLESMAAFVQFSGERQLKLDEFSAVVSEILGDESVPFAPSAVGVALYEPNTILGASFDHLFVIGMAEGVFPAPATENPVIDFYERKLLSKHGIKFEEAAEVARWEALSFYFTILAGRQTVHFSYPSTVDNGERVPNAFFDRLQLKPLKSANSPDTVSSCEERRTALLRTKESLADDPVIDAARLQYAVELNRENSPNYDEYDGVIGEEIDPSKRRWSASQLTAIGQCAFRWFAQRLLRLIPIDEVALGLDYTKRGSFYHKVLQIAVDKAKNVADIRSATLASLEEAFAAAEADPEVALPTLVNWDLQRNDHLTAIRKAIESVEFIGEGAGVVALEQKFECTWNGFPLVGYIDRVDNTPGGLIAIDYKTGSTPPKGAKDEAGKLSIDVQLPLYSKVALSNLYPSENLGESHYYSLTKGKVLRREKGDDLAKLEGLAERIKETLADGNFAVNPDTNKVACAFCQYEPVCRKGPRLERKSINQ